MDQQLSVLVAVVEQSGFSRAAQTLNMTQPAVSQQIRTLERSLGTQLLERTNKYVRLTAAGEIVYEHARQIVTLEQQLRRYVADLTQTASGPLAIGASYTIGEYLLPRVLAGFQKQFPQVVPAVTIANTQRIADLVAARRLDLGVVEGLVAPSTLDVHSLMDDQLVVVAPMQHQFSAQARDTVLQPSDLADVTWIMREEGSGTRAVTDAFFEREGLLPSARLVFGSTQMIKEAVEAGMGVALISRWAIRKELDLGVLAVLQVAGTPCIRRFSAIVARGRFRSKATATFLQVVEDRAAALAAESAAWQQ